MVSADLLRPPPYNPEALYVNLRVPVVHHYIFIFFQNKAVILNTNRPKHNEG